MPLIRRTRLNNDEAPKEIPHIKVSQNNGNNEQEQSVLANPDDFSQDPSVLAQLQKLQNHERSILKMTEQLNSSTPFEIHNMEQVEDEAKADTNENAGQSITQIFVTEVQIPLPFSILIEMEEQYQSIPLPLISIVKPDPEVQAAMSLVFDWNDALTYRLFLLSLHKFASQLDLETKQNWNRSLAQALTSMKEQVNHLLNKENGYMEDVELIAKNMFLEDLLNLKPLEQFQVLAPNEALDLNAVISEIKAEIKNGTKVTFKTIQQLQSQLEELQFPLKEVHAQTIEQPPIPTHAPIISQQQLVDLTEEIEQLKMRQRQSVLTMIKAVDMLDLIKNSAIQTGLSDQWTNQIDQTIQTYLQELEQFDTKEIQALGHILDGQYMISIGTVPQEAAPGYEKYEVCIVHERGFMEISTGNIIREAKVLSVY